MLYRHRIRKEIGDALVVWVNPRKIKLHAGTNQPYTRSAKEKLACIEGAFPSASKYTKFFHSALYSIEPFSVRRGLLNFLVPVEADPRYEKLEDYIRHMQSPQECRWYGELVNQVLRDGCAHHKGLTFRNTGEVDAFFNGYLRDLVDSMATIGYDKSKSRDVGTALIGSDGSILKSHAGNHRFIVARIVGVPLIPLEILGAHEFWMREMQINGSIQKLAAGIREVERMNCGRSEDSLHGPFAPRLLDRREAGPPENAANPHAVLSRH